MRLILQVLFPAVDLALLNMFEQGDVRTANLQIDDASQVAGGKWPKFKKFHFSDPDELSCTFDSDLAGYD